ncbi:YgiW/YdeI family stress tolerance OB fold protein [Jejubacter calystegiae]|uniref:YgiW/YdeI family stress tolerance OB fold protein n=1 Tax=Jejubacter calystegiae TaxID=2579935 RepID=A0A4P8YQB1_9ENTR|nr:YgiW/YdeI family stress tolerance OB fold protein [Jejubacter calystegiae]QCT22306.1 YgiW/YdeI family stress tolerance OB fold protein [Jejubacter calystegiae]
MKKSVLALLFAAATLTTTSAMAQNGGFSGPDTQSTQRQGGFVGPNVSNTTVEKAKGLRDDSWVVLEGSIVRKVGKELYEFRDASGSVNVDIDDDIWGGLTVTPKDKVRIEGEVDKDWNSVEIDVKRITKP